MDGWNPTSASSRWIPLISKSNMKSSATRLGKTVKHQVISHRSHEGKQWTWVKHCVCQRTLCRGPAEPQHPGPPAVSSSFGTTPHSCSAWFKHVEDMTTIKRHGERSHTVFDYLRCIMVLQDACFTSPRLCRSLCRSFLLLYETLDLDGPLLQSLPEMGVKVRICSLLEYKEGESRSRFWSKRLGIKKASLISQASHQSLYWTILDLFIVPSATNNVSQRHFLHFTS